MEASSHCTRLLRRFEPSVLVPSRRIDKRDNDQTAVVSFSSGDRTRTYDLRVMSPTSYQLLYPAMWIAKVGSIFEFSKLIGKDLIGAVRARFETCHEA